MSDHSDSDKSEVPPEWFLNNILMGNYDQLPSSELQQEAEANEDPTDQDEQMPDNMSDYSGSEASEIPPEWFLNDVIRMGGVYAAVAAEYEQQAAAESPLITQAQCQAEPEDAETRRSRAFASLPTRETAWDLSARPEQHPDSDLAIDELWARLDDKFGPTFWPNADFLDAKLDGPTSLTVDYLNPVSPPKEPVDVTLDDGSTLTLHPHYPAYERSYYDDLTYGDQGPKEGYRFTTAAQILLGYPKNYDGVGWSPEHYAGLANTIPVPPTAYTKPRHKNSESAPIWKSLLHSDHDLAYYVGLARRPLRFMYQQGTGMVHPSFPRTWGHVALLTEDQLDSIAEFYHQTGNEDWKTASRWWAQYPCPVQWKTNEDNVWVKRRKMMNFIGIRQPELPPVEVCQMLKDLEDEVQRRNDARREEERRIDDMYAKMFLAGGGVI
ncbi:hypothetical protein GE09DRAFT_787258 [Coniochaeta sp. 2T2.1]|nr:hypothetical protein GE09DRAFT_787258 [Coniochaeta sp. 2T2.1]